jgi:predicted signal transduction protein with EAL and GGDEF domain
LKTLPLDELKIDRSFVKDFTKNSVDLTIVQTILQMGKNLNLRIVAEGVETEGQMAYLSNYGCNLFQGYFFAKPITIGSFEENIAQLLADQQTLVTTEITANLDNKILRKARSKTNKSTFNKPSAIYYKPNEGNEVGLDNLTKH